jgi:transcriptional regulator GlxA family with amidase domain
MLPGSSRATMAFSIRPASNDNPHATLLSASVRRAHEAGAARKGYGRSLAPWKLKQVTAFMHANLAENLQLSELAAICGLSKSYFGRAFKASTGLPPHNWLLTMRIERACTMLTETGASIADVACATGFSDQSHFTRFFSRIVGMSPGAWRRALIR